MEGHAAMDMSVPGATWHERLFSTQGFTAVSQMDWASVWLDIVIGLVAAGLISAFVPESFWSAFFLADHPLGAKIAGPLIGPLVAIVAFVCSVGNVPLAAVLWAGGSSFGGVIAFIFADLIVLPLLNIYRKYYGAKMSAFLFVAMFASMSAAALVIEFVFQALHLVPSERHARIVEASISMNYTTVLNIIFLAIAALLLWRFFTTGGVPMLRMMDEMPEESSH